jgi:hypothetical protein
MAHLPHSLLLKIYVDATSVYQITCAKYQGYKGSSSRNIAVVAVQCEIKLCQVDVFSTMVSTCNALNMCAYKIIRMHWSICLPLWGLLEHLRHLTIYFSLPH